MEPESKEPELLLYQVDDPNVEATYQYFSLFRLTEALDSASSPCLPPSSRDI